MLSLPGVPPSEMEICVSEGGLGQPWPASVRKQSLPSSPSVPVPYDKMPWSVNTVKITGQVLTLLRSHCFSSVKAIPAVSPSSLQWFLCP